jgi:hypothetical protein
VTAVMLGHMLTCMRVFIISGLSEVKNDGARTSRAPTMLNGITVLLGLPAHAHAHVSAHMSRPHKARAGQSLVGAKTDHDQLQSCGVENRRRQRAGIAEDAAFFC